MSVLDRRELVTPTGVSPSRIGGLDGVRALAVVAVLVFHASAAWAPEAYEVGPWAERIRSTPPFIVDASGVVAGFAVLREDGTIDQFFVAPAFAGQGVARMLMAHIHQQAARRGLTELQADVSLTAEPFFLMSGFEVEGRHEVARTEVSLSYARMRKRLRIAAV